MENTENTYNVSVLERKSLDLLETYQGANNYIIRLRQKQIDNKKFYPTRAQAEYIINYHEMAPKVAKKWVELDSYFAQKIANDKLNHKLNICNHEKNTFLWNFNPFLCKFISTRR